MWARAWRRFWKRQDGVAALETALIFPAITLVILLIMDLGLFFFDFVSAGNAVREGARCGAVGHADAEIENRVQETAGFDTPVTVAVDRTGGQIGDDIVVTATFNHDWLLPATVLGVPDSFDIASTMRLESLIPAGSFCGGP